MLYPYTSLGSRAQKWQILRVAVLSIMLAGAVVYHYEHNYRLPSESIFFGDWQMTFDDGNKLYVRFNSNQTFYALDRDGKDYPEISGRWYEYVCSLYGRRLG